jgi:spoIIIJ-associated protein
MAGTPAEEALRELLEKLVEALGLDAQIEVTDDGDLVRGSLTGEDLGLFIGRHGQTIDAVQHIAMRVVANAADERRRVEIDAEGYRERRAELLQGQADVAAEDALRFERPVSLDAMSAAERKLVHEYLRERGDVETYSQGDEPHRHLVVAPLRSVS